MESYYRPSIRMGIPNLDTLSLLAWWWRQRGPTLDFALSVNKILMLEHGWHFLHKNNVVDYEYTIRSIRKVVIMESKKSLVLRHHEVIRRIKVIKFLLWVKSKVLWKGKCSIIKDFSLFYKAKLSQCFSFVFVLYVKMSKWFSLGSMWRYLSSWIYIETEINVNVTLKKFS